MLSRSRVEDLATTGGGNPRVLVLGAGGFYGRRVVRALRGVDGIEVVRGSRRGPVAVDLTHRQTFARLEGFAVVINCADTIRASPVAAAQQVLETGGCWMDMGADPQTASRLLALHADEPRGHVVVGVGVFPGLSTMLARHVAELATDLRSLDLAIRVSPLSGSGLGNCALMLAMLEQPGFDFFEGRRRERPGVGGSIDVRYPGVGTDIAHALTLPDTTLVRVSTHAPSVATHMTTVPGFLVRSFGLIAWLLLRAGPLRGMLRASMLASLWLMRALLLRGVTSRVSMTAIANRGESDEVVRGLDFADGQAATATGVAATVRLWCQRPQPEPGCYSPAQLFVLDEALVAAQRSGLTAATLVDP